jgi:hypothetical protein
MLDTAVTLRTYECTQAPALLALRTPVIAFVVVDGARETSPVHGCIVGRTREAAPRYDVRADDGTIYRELPASAIEPAPPVQIVPDMEDVTTVRAA